MPQVTNPERLLVYLDAYARKDIAAVATMLADDVTLRDWNLAVRGKPLRWPRPPRTSALRAR